MILPLRRPIALLLLGVAAAGCHKSPPPAAVESSVASGERARRLALLTPPGGQPVDLLLRTLQDRARRDPQKVDWWIALGQSWVRKARESTDSGYYANARACAEVALAIQPTSHLALDLQAQVLLNEHRFAEARDLARHTLALRGDDVMAWGSLADALYELGQLDEAEAAVQKMMELKPGLPAYSRASYLQWVRGQSKAAKESIRLAVDSAGAAARDPEPRAWAQWRSNGSSRFRWKRR